MGLGFVLHVLQVSFDLVDVVSGLGGGSGDRGRFVAVGVEISAGRGDGVVGGGVLDDKTLVVVDALEDGRLFDSPFTNVCPLLVIL